MDKWIKISGAKMLLQPVTVVARTNDGGLRQGKDLSEGRFSLTLP